MAQDEELTAEGAVAELHHAGLIDPSLTQCEALAGGTTSRIAALSRPGSPPQLVVKINAPDMVRAEAVFLRAYAASSLLPPLRYVDPTHRLLVSDFVPGSKIRYGENGVDTSEVLLTLTRDLLAGYVPADPGHGIRQGVVGPVAELLAEGCAAGVGTTGQETPLSRTWPQFLGDHVAYRDAALAPYVPEADRQWVGQIARADRRIEDAPLCLIHGDSGAHNFLFERRGSGVGRLCAVIDPDPLVGYPIFDLAFAFVSWPNGLDPEAILPAAKALLDAGRWRPNGALRRVLWEEVAIALYMRLATCLFHHPEDLQAYLEAWPRWRALAT